MEENGWGLGTEEGPSRYPHHLGLRTGRGGGGREASKGVKLRKCRKERYHRR